MAWGSFTRSAASRVLLITSALVSSVVEIWSFCAVGITALSFVNLVKLKDRTASRRPPATASPKERPNEPAAEFTPAASLTRSSSMGDSVKLLSWDTRRPKPDPVISNGKKRAQPDSALRHDRDDGGHPDRAEGESDEHQVRRASPSGPLPCDERDREHAQREWCEGQPGTHRVVFERHLQEQRQRDHRPTERDLLHRLLGDAESEMREPEQVRIDQRELTPLLAPHEPPRQQDERDRAERDEQHHVVAALLPDKNSEDDAAHADDRQERAHHVDAAHAGVFDVTDERRN